MPIGDQLPLTVLLIWLGDDHKQAHSQLVVDTHAIRVICAFLLANDVDVNGQFISDQWRSFF